MPASLRFYQEVLGFKLDWGGDGDMVHIASVSRDGHAIMLQCRKPFYPGCIWIGGTPLVPLWNRIQSSAIPIVLPPTNQPWGLEMKILDPDANVLWFGTEPLDNVPFGTEPTLAQLNRTS